MIDHDDVRWAVLKRPREFFRLFPPKFQDSKTKITIDGGERTVNVHQVNLSALVEDIKDHVFGAGIIEPHERDWKPKNWDGVTPIVPRDLAVQAWLKRCEKGADIYVTTHANFCWSRWLLAKELGHLLVDTSHDNYTREPLALICELTTGMPEDFREMSIPAFSDVITRTTAMELLLPLEISDELYELRDSGVSVEMIAHRYKVPKNYVERRLNSVYAKSYHDFVDQIEKELDQEQQGTSPYPGGNS